MAMELKTFTNKLFKPTLNLVRNRSRVALPTLFWEDPIQRHRNFIADFMNSMYSYPFLSPFQRNTTFREPLINIWEMENYYSNPKDGFQVSLDVKKFSPNEIHVRVIDNSVVVEAKHEERAENGESYISRNFTRRYVLSDGFNVNEIVSTLSSDGILTVQVPPKQIDPNSVPRDITTQQTGSPARNTNQDGTISKGTTFRNGKM